MKNKVGLIVIIKRNSELHYIGRELGFNKGEVLFTLRVEFGEMIREMPCYSRGTVSTMAHR